MNKEHLIKLARDLAESFVYNKRIVYQVEHLYMLSMSNFIFTKEKMIKTDSKNNILYFNDTKENVMIINQFYEKIKDDFIFTMDDSTPQKELFNRVILEHGEEDLELKKKIFIIGKIRDSLAHGKYEFDTKKNKIIMKSRYKVGNNDFNFECSIEPETLDILTKQYREKNRNRIINQICDEALNDRTCFEDKLSGAEVHVQDSVEEHIKKEHNQVELLRARMQDDEERYSKNKKEVMDLLKNTDNESFRQERLREIIDDTIYSMTMSLSKVERDDCNTAAVYYYLTLLLSEKKVLNFSFLKNPSEDVFIEKRIDGKEDDIIGALGILKRAIKSFNKGFQKNLDRPDSTEKVEKMKEIYSDLYNEIKKAFKIRNGRIYDGIRNGIMHACIETSNGELIIKDSLKHDMTNPTFSCKASNEELLEYGKYIEENNSQERYTLATLILELNITLNSYGKNYEESFKNFYKNFRVFIKYLEMNTDLNTFDISTLNTEELLQKITNSQSNSLETRLPLDEENLDDRPLSM